MITQKYRLALARMLKLYKEYSTDQGLLICETDGELTVGTNVYVESEEGLIPAKNGEYINIVENLIYTVEGGAISAITEKPIENSIEVDNIKETIEESVPEETVPEESVTEEKVEETDENNETNDASAEPEVEDKTETPESETETPESKTEAEIKIDELETKNAELEARIAELEAIIAEYKKKEEEVNPTVEEMEKFQNQKTGNTILDKKMKAAKQISISL